MPLIKSGSLAFRYEFEKHRNPGLSESELKEMVISILPIFFLIISI